MRTESIDFRDRAMARLRQIPGMGILLAFLSSICLATASLSVEFMGGTDAVFIVLCRALIQFIFYLPLSIFFRDPITLVPGERWIMLQRSIYGLISFVTCYKALSFLSLSDSQSIVFSSPVYTSFVGCIFLGESCGIFQIATIVTTLAGVVLIARPTFIFPVDTSHDEFSPQDRIIGVTLAFVCSLAQAFVYLSLRRLQKTPTTLVITGFSFLMAAFAAILLAILYYATPLEVIFPTTLSHWGFIFLNGMCGVVGQGFLTIAVKIEEAGLVSLTRTFDIVLAFIYQIILLKNQHVYWTSILGAVIVSSGCVAVAVKKIWFAKKSLQSDEKSSEPIQPEQVVVKKLEEVE